MCCGVWQIFVVMVQRMGVAMMMILMLKMAMTQQTSTGPG